MPDSHLPLWQRWLRAWRPARTGVNTRERLRVALGAVFGIGLVVLLCHPQAAPAAGAWPWIVAPMGASAVLVFGVPASPFAHPWSVLGGHVVAALVGVACVRLIGPAHWAMAPAVGLAIAAMFALRCLHPPGGATALLATWLGAADWHFALDPVGLNAALLVLAGVLWNNATGRRYPFVAAPAVRAQPTLEADLDAVLARHNRVLDIGRDELKALIDDTQWQAHQRRLADTRCGDIMATQLVTVQPATPLADAWPLFRHHRIKALPVLGADGVLAGIVTPADFTRDEADGSRRRTPGTVADVMTRSVTVASADTHLSELLPLLARSGHHHVPIVDDARRLRGIVTQSDVVAALCRPS